MRNLAVFAFLLLLFPGCKAVQPPSPVKTVSWTDHTGAEMKDVSQLGYGVTLRALIDGSRFYYLGSLRDSNLVALHCVDLETGTGKRFKPIPKELESFTVEGLVPGESGVVGLLYRSQDNKVMVAAFGPNGWVVEPGVALEAPQGASEDDGSGLHHTTVSGGAWVDGRLVFYVFRGYPSSPFEHQGLNRIVLSLDGEVQAEQESWPEPSGFDKDRMRILGSYYDPGKGWFHCLFTDKEKGNSIWRYQVDGKWEEVASGLDIDLRNSLSCIDRTAVNAIGFETFKAKLDPDALFRWVPPDRMEKVAVTNPEGFDPWDRLYRVEEGKLTFVPCLMGSSTIYQKVGDHFLTAMRSETGSVLHRADGSTQPLAEGVEFPDGYNDFVFLNHQGKVWVVQFNGERVEVGLGFLLLNCERSRKSPRGKWEFQE